MGKIPEPETKRDKKLIRDYLSKKKHAWTYSLSQIGIRYARIEDDKIIPLTASRIHQILDKNGVKKVRHKRKKKNKVEILDK